MGIERQQSWPDLILELAWAAGFFDGEGSTGVSRLANRPGAVCVFMSVSQGASSAAAMPEVLERFERVMRNTGGVGPPHWDDRFGGCYIYQWRTNSFEEVQALVALLWAQLGSVKRAQAAEALGLYHAQFTTIRARHRTPTRPRRLNLPPVGPRPALRAIDLAWAAGLFDGEGSTELHKRRCGGSAHFAMRTRVSQCGDDGPPAVLRRFQQIVGCGWIEGPSSGKGYTNAYKWSAGAAEAMQVLPLIWPWLGEVKRAQALDVLSRVDELPVARRYPWRTLASAFLSSH